MLSITAYPASRSIAIPANRPSGPLAYIRAATFCLWMFLLIFWFWTIKDWQAMALTENNFKGYFYAGFAICALMHLTLGLGPWFAAPFQVTSTWSGALFSVFFALA